MTTSTTSERPAEVAAPPHYEGVLARVAAWRAEHPELAGRLEAAARDGDTSAAETLRHLYRTGSLDEASVVQPLSHLSPRHRPRMPPSLPT